LAMWCTGLCSNNW